MVHRAAVLVVTVVVSLAAGVGAAAPQLAGKPAIDTGSVESVALLGLETGTGITVDVAADQVVVTKVDAAGPWQALGIRTGDVIVALDGEVVTSASRLWSVALSMRYRDVAYVEVIRRKKPVLVRRVISTPTTLAGVNYKLPSATTTSPHPGRGLSGRASWISSG